jgi:hypothetical protein
MERRLLTRQQVAELLGVSTMTIIRLEGCGLTPLKLTGKPASRTHYDAAEIGALIAKRHAAATSAARGGVSPKSRTKKIRG